MAGIVVTNDDQVRSVVQDGLAADMAVIGKDLHHIAEVAGGAGVAAEQLRDTYFMPAEVGGRFDMIDTDIPDKQTPGGPEHG